MWTLVTQMLRVIGMQSSVTLPRTLPFSFFPLSLPLTYLFESLHVSETHIKPARAATTCSRAKKIKMQLDQLEILTPRAPENSCHRKAAQLCNLVLLKKNKFVLKKKIHQHIAYIYS